MLKINGKTKLVGIMGYPLEHTLSPIFHNAAFNYLDLNWCYIPIPVEEKFFDKAKEGIRVIKNFVGVNITMPYKEKVLPCLDEISSYAQVIGAVNTIHIVDNGRLVGYNTDGRGFLTALSQDGGFNPKNKNVLIIGAGGASRAVAVSLALSGIKKLKILNRTLDKAEAIRSKIISNFACEVEIFNFQSNLENCFSSIDLIVNATPVGMVKEEYPFPVELISREHFVCDLIYEPLETPLIRAAKEKGAKTLNGLNMLLYQGAAAFKIWTHIDPPIEVMRKALEDALELKKN
ncbi:shikimate dehydrogenase [Candidatus Oleimmundimicrobium sp.]|uniref:shikimate dehydrogenase n=1 Tax=Candidatus Oleimmundimicrobium sp. TaxID=3060597 RepID=UPI00271BB882|nr:shikimate dehydrogenase [Candidatus Oleimmundimicrobium sp.]MDO8886746.1 shikimate dehydrogenase [Candidatus Oleimmundimicrobium sp.]